MFEHRPFGETLKLSVRGASHAPWISFSLEGFPQGQRIDESRLAAFMERRAPGRDGLSTQRRESDEIEFLEGLESSVSTGGVIRGRIRNRDQRPGDYGSEIKVPRPGHADFGQWIEYGAIPTGGGSNSGRMTAALAAAGGMCLQYLARRGISISAEILSVGGKSDGFDETIAAARDEGDSVGGVIRCTATGVPPGLGGALFAGVETELSAALFAVPGVKGVEFGNGFSASSVKGSENNDPFAVEDFKIVTQGNNHGGILGGRTTGMPLEVKVAMKPTPTVFKSQRSVDLESFLEAEKVSAGRHDPCIVKRALCVIEAMTAFVLSDMILTVESATPRICLTLTGRTIDECVAQFNSQRYFSDMVELRADMLDPEERAKAGELPGKLPVPVILTFRRAVDGGRFEGPESEREAFFRSMLEAKAPFAYVDFEDDFRNAELEAMARNQGVRVIRSLHVFESVSPNVADEIERLRGGSSDIPKIAFMPGSSADVAKLLTRAVPEKSGRNHIVCAMGPMGIASRALAIRTGSMLMYASVGSLGEIGHVSPRELVRTYRFRNQTKSFDLYGVTGWPLKATLSPAIHNAAFAAADVDAVMVPVPCRSAEEALEFMKASSMKGMAVTIPHKESIMELLDEIDPVARKIGAVNTVAVERGRYVGYNTDFEGFAEAFKEFVGETRINRAAILGAGGAAKAVMAAFEKMGIVYEVFHRRTPGEGFDCIVNATPVDPIGDYRFTGREMVYDLTYVPEVTPLMARAAAAGCRTENGLSMLIQQARGQRRIWKI